MKEKQFYQVSTLQALLLGYTRGVITVEELRSHGDTGLGTFENVNGEMIVLDHKVFKADDQGRVMEADPKEGVPFAAVAHMEDAVAFSIRAGESIEDLKTQLNLVIDEDFGLNSMYIVRLDGHFSRVKARSEEGYRSDHIELSEILRKKQKDFLFENTTGTVVCVYFPDYMDGINASGWHFHYLSEDRTCGGHIYDLSFGNLNAKRTRLHNIHIQLPMDASFDTYALKSVSEEEVKKVEQ